MTIVLFDVCHTLYESNTTFDFLADYFSGDSAYQILAAKRRSLSGRIRAKFGSFEKDLRRDFVSLLDGEPESKLRKRAVEFIRQQNTIDATHELLNEAKLRGDQVHLVSGSLDFIVEAVADELSVDASHCTRLMYEDQICRGIITDDLDGHKADLLKREFRGEDLVMISDNFSDGTCIELVRAFHPVYRLGDKRAERYWANKPVANPVCYG